MDKAVQMKIGGIKCDSQGCDYRDDNVKVEDYADWLNKPCPKCNGNLLTQDDYDNTQMIINIVNMMNSIYALPNEDEELYSLKIEMNGTGKMDMDIKKL